MASPFQILAAVRGEKGEQRVFHEVDGRNRRDASRALKVWADRLHGKACGRDQAIGAPARSQERIVHEGHHMRVLMRVDTEIATLVGEGLEIALDLLAEFAGKLLANAVAVAGAQRRCHQVSHKGMGEGSALVHQQRHVVGVGDRMPFHDIEVQAKLYLSRVDERTDKLGAFVKRRAVREHAHARQGSMAAACVRKLEDGLRLLDGNPKVVCVNDERHKPPFHVRARCLSSKRYLFEDKRDKRNNSTLMQVCYWGSFAREGL